MQLESFTKLTHFSLVTHLLNKALINLIQTKWEIASDDESHLLFGGIQLKARHGEWKGQLIYVKVSHGEWKDQIIYVHPLKTDSKRLNFALKAIFRYKFLLALTKKKSFIFSRKSIFLLLEMIIIIPSIEKELGGNKLTFQPSSK